MEIDLVLHGNLVDVYSGEVCEAYVGLRGSRVELVQRQSIGGGRLLDVFPRYILPGLIDAHIHIESSMLTPGRFAEAAVPKGTTCVVCDPHEIANVMGVKGVEYMLQSSSNTPLRFYYMIPSCVPASKLETTGGVIGAAEVARLRDDPRILGLAEVMNYPGVIHKDEELLDKIALCRGMVVDGHCPGLTGRELREYVEAGISSDHECISREEALEKLSLGMHIMVREGSASKDMHELLKAVTEKNRGRFMMVTDDLSPSDIVARGHVDHLLRRAVEEGLDPITALRMVTLNPAEYYGLEHLGGVAPGKAGDLVVVDDLRRFRVSTVVINGRVVAREGSPLFVGTGAARHVGSPMNFTMSTEKLAIRCSQPYAKARVIEVFDGSLYTFERHVIMNPQKDMLTSDPENDILKACAVERYHGTGNVGIGLVKGFGLRQGALASSIAHDSHNVVAVGVNDREICQAVNILKSMGGGIAVVNHGEVMGALSLSVAGLMSDEPPERVAEDLQRVEGRARALGCSLSNPFSTLSFLALAVIPELKLTDMGLVDVTKGRLVDLLLQK